MLPFYELKALHGEERVEAATVFDNRDGAELTLDVDAVVLGLGFLANLGPIKQWGLELAKNSILVDRTFQTNLPAVYAVGDIATYDGKLKLIATATASSKKFDVPMRAAGAATENGTRQNQAQP